MGWMFGSFDSTTARRADRALLIAKASGKIAIPMQSVEGILTVQQTREVSGEEVMVWRDKVTPVVRARAMFGMPPMDGGLSLCLSRADISPGKRLRAEFAHHFTHILSACVGRV